MDSIDINILNSLLSNSRQSTTSISKEIAISNVATQQRISRLEEKGIILAHTTKINLAGVGYNTQAFIGIYLERARHYQEVISKLKEIPEVIEAHFTTGTYSIFAKIIAYNNQHLMEILNNQVQNIDGISRTETFISLDQGINKTIQLDTNR